MEGRLKALSRRLFGWRERKPHPKKPPPRTEQEFRTRLLEVLERAPKKQPFLLLNSSFFLWILSAAGIAVGGSYFAAKQKCLLDIERMDSQLTRLNMELKVRHLFNEKAIFESKSISEVRARIAALPSALAEFKDKGPIDLWLERSEIFKRGHEVDGEDYSNTDESVTALDKVLYALKYNQELTDDDLPALQSEITETRERDKLKPIIILEPDCSIGNVFSQMTYGHNKVYAKFVGYPQTTGDAPAKSDDIVK